MVITVLGFTAPIVPFLAGMYHSFFYPYADHPYKEEKFFVYMHKMILLGTLLATTAFFTTGYHVGLGTITTIFIVAFANTIAGYDFLIRVRPYGPWRYARLRPYFTYQKQHKNINSHPTDT